MWLGGVSFADDFLDLFNMAVDHNATVAEMGSCRDFMWC